MDVFECKYNSIERLTSTVERHVESSLDVAQIWLVSARVSVLELLKWSYKDQQTASPCLHFMHVCGTATNLAQIWSVSIAGVSSVASMILG